MLDKTSSQEIKSTIESKLFRIDPRIGLVSVMVVILLPLISLTVYTSFQQRQISMNNIENETKLLAQIASFNQKQIFDVSRQLAVSLSSVPQVRDENKPEVCNNLLADLLQKSPLYSNIALADISGNVYCSAQPLESKINISDRLYFQKALVTKDLEIGNYVVSKITNKPTVQLAYPLIDEDRKVWAVIYMALNLDWINTIIADANLPKGADFFMIDNEGTILARYPESEKWVGKKPIDKPIIKRIIKDRQGTANLRGVDDIPKIFAYAPVGRDTDAFVAVGYRKDVAFHPLRLLFRQNLIAYGIITFIAVLFAWLIGKILIVKKAEDLEKVDKLKDEFVSTASHELRTPLTAIDGLSSMILDGEYGTVSKNLKQPLEDIKSSSERLINLVNDLLDLSRIEAKKLKFELSEFFISDKIFHIVELLQPIYKKKNIELKTGSLDRSTVLADSDKIEQIITNLVGNALKFTDIGSVIVSAKAIDNSVRVSVADSGRGIAKEDQSSLFSRFQQLKSDRGKPAGTGLGLYISREMIRKMGGDLWLSSSEIGKGSTFVFSIPIAKSKLAQNVKKEIQKEMNVNTDRESNNNPIS